MTEKAENAVKWINTLLTTELNQGRGALGDVESGFCCLGVGCYTLSINYDKYDGTDPDFSDTVGLLNEFGNPTSAGISNDTCTNFDDALVSLNDLHGKTFRQIGYTLIEKPYKYFSEEIADQIEEYFSLPDLLEEIEKEKQLVTQ